MIEENGFEAKTSTPREAHEAKVARVLREIRRRVLKRARDAFIHDFLAREEHGRRNGTR